ncbi:MAG TPA: hydroxyacid dehydrogenase [Dehalococcoidia bacterium]|nr:hydroxyacid dehydrogenase [Dehalococcoidia bacterium]
MKHLKVIVTEPVDPAGLALLAESTDLHYLPDRPGARLPDVITGASALGVRLAPVTAELMDMAPHLRVIAKHGVGVDNIDVEAATERNIVVVSTPRANAVSVAEHIVSLMLCLANRVCAADADLKSGTFRTREDYVGVELQGKVMGLVGLGRIGREAARICRAGFEMKVVAYDPLLPRDTFDLAGVTQATTLDGLLSESDFVALCVPLSDATRNMIGVRELALMKPTSFLINTARGGLVDEGALYRALRSGVLAGAAADAFVREPPSRDNPLLTLDNFIATPHVGGATREAMRRMSLDMADEIVRVLSGARPQFPVNPEVYK